MRNLCAKASLSQKGNLQILRDALVCNFLDKATAEQIMNADSAPVWAPGLTKFIKQDRINVI